MKNNLIKENLLNLTIQIGIYASELSKVKYNEINETKNTKTDCKQIHLCHDSNYWQKEFCDSFYALENWNTHVFHLLILSSGFNNLYCWKSEFNHLNAAKSRS